MYGNRILWYCCSMLASCCLVCSIAAKFGGDDRSPPLEAVIDCKIHETNRIIEAPNHHHPSCRPLPFPTYLDSGYLLPPFPRPLLLSYDSRQAKPKGNAACLSHQFGPLAKTATIWQRHLGGYARASHSMSRFRSTSIGSMRAKGFEEQSLFGLDILESWSWRPRSSAMDHCTHPTSTARRTW